MIDNLDNHFQSFAIGVKYNNHFVIADNIGAIADIVLTSEKKYFNTETFPLIRRTIDTGLLTNKEEADNTNPRSLTITPADMILNYTPSSVNEMPDILKEFKELIIDLVMNQYHIKGISRIGYLIKYKLEARELSDDFIKKTVGDVDDVSDLILRFSKKLAIERSLLNKDRNDYHNAIYTIVKESGKSEIHAVMDFQRYYDPKLKSSEAIAFDKFIEEAGKYRKSHFLDWLNNQYGKK